MTNRASAIQQEIRQSRPFRSTGHEAVVALFRTADVVRRYYGGVVGRGGVTLQQYNVLRILRGAGPEGLPTLDVAERMVQHAPGITRMIDRLAARGWVRRRRISKDRRQVHCVVTAAGLALLARLDAIQSGVDGTRVPLAHADYAYNLKLHIELVRTRLERLRQKAGDS